MQTEQAQTLIWFTTNLRTTDNQVVSEATNTSENCTAVYCLDPELITPQKLGFPKLGKFRLKFLLESLDNLAAQLSELGIPFHVIVGNPKKDLPEFIKTQNIKSVYLQNDWTTEERTTLAEIKEASPSNIQWTEIMDQFLIHPDDVPFELKELPFMFTEFRRLIEKSFVIRSETSISNKLRKTKVHKATIPTLSSLGIQDFNQDIRTSFPFQGGTTAAMERLIHYLWNTDAILAYKETRNGLIGLDYSSKLSPWLANGAISARSIYHELKKYEAERGANESTYWLVFELLWRDFFKYVSLKFGDRIFHAKGIRSKHNSWKQNTEIFGKWMDGTTESAFVNANMNELKVTGWMSNRGRQNVASFLTKTLGIDWRWGAAYFESLLLDYDVHSNYGNWMYVAGVGNDPRDRFFNVEKQAHQYDPNLEFQNRWLSKTFSV